MLILRLMLNYQYQHQYIGICKNVPYENGVIDIVGIRPKTYRDDMYEVINSKSENALKQGKEKLKELKEGMPEKVNNLYLFNSATKKMYIYAWDRLNELDPRHIRVIKFPPYDDMP